MLCCDVAGENAALDLASRLAAAIAEPVPLGAGEVFITASIGIALSGAAGDTPETLLRDADTAMYRAKADGRSQTCVFREDNRAFAVAQLRTGNDLHRALERNEFEVHYQPIMELREDRLVGFEASALAASEPWPAGPGPVHALAEDTGLIVSIGAWVLETACAQPCGGRPGAVGTGPLFINVDLSPRQLADPTFPAPSRTSCPAPGSRVRRSASRSPRTR